MTHVQKFQISQINAYQVTWKHFSNVFCQNSLTVPYEHTELTSFGKFQFNRGGSTHFQKLFNWDFEYSKCLV